MGRDTLFRQRCPSNVPGRVPHRLPRDKMGVVPRVIYTLPGIKSVGPLLNPPADLGVQILGPQAVYVHGTVRREANSIEPSVPCRQPLVRQADITNFCVATWSHLSCVLPLPYVPWATGTVKRPPWTNPFMLCIQLVDLVQDTAHHIGVEGVVQPHIVIRNLLVNAVIEVNQPACQGFHSGMLVHVGVLEHKIDTELTPRNDGKDDHPENLLAIVPCSVPRGALSVTPLVKQWEVKGSLELNAARQRMERGYLEVGDPFGNVPYNLLVSIWANVPHGE